MGQETARCSSCGGTIRYESGFWSAGPKSDGLFGYICATCAAEEQERERHKERSAEARRSARDAEGRAEAAREQMEEHARRMEAAEAAAAERIADEIEAAAYEYNNPGDYECPSCLYDTLLWGSRRCPKCHANVPAGMWAAIQAQQEAEKRVREAEWRRMAPVREAKVIVEPVSELLKAKMEAWRKARWNAWAFLISLVVTVAGHKFFAGDYALVDGMATVWRAIIGLFFMFTLPFGYVAVPVLLVAALVRGVDFLMKCPDWNRKLRDAAARYEPLSQNSLVKSQFPFPDDVPLLGRTLRGCLLWIVVFSVFCNIRWTWFDKREESQQTPVADLRQVPGMNESHSESPRPVAPVNLPGERYPVTRMRVMSEGELASMSKTEIQYAINEMFARRGAAYSKAELRRQFEPLSWYRPETGVSLETIESRFSPIEKHNLELLARQRAMLNRSN